MPDLSDETVERYGAEGVIVLRNYFATETVRTIAAELDGYIDDTLTRLTEAFWSKEADGRTLCGLFWMNIFRPLFAEMFDSPTQMETIERLTSWQPRSFFAEAFMKPARCVDTISPHQDIAYSAVSPHQQATIWAPIDAVRADKGAVCYLAGWHQSGLFDHGQSSLAGSSLVLDRPEGYHVLQFDLDPGDVLVHDGLVMHDSGPNLTEHPRRALAFCYRGANTSFDKLVI